MSTSKNHHWWPKGVSNFWKDADGCVGRLSPNGELLRLDPKKFGVIGHGHSVKLSRTPGQTTVWDHNFENEFQRADDNLPKVVRWLEELDRTERKSTSKLSDRFVESKNPPEDILSLLVEGLISLAIRSPMTRNAYARAAEKFRGSVPERERNAIIALNMQRRQRMFVEAIGIRGKFAVLFSPDREYIFGDGFFHNFTSPSNAPMLPEILVPLTPQISVLYARPAQYSTEPKLSTVVLGADEVAMLNHTIQIYSKEMLFYRSERPPITEEFRRNQHLQYSGPSSPIDKLIYSIPGISPSMSQYLTP